MRLYFNTMFLFFLSLVFLASCPLIGQTEQVKAFDTYVEQSRQKFQVPGCAVAVVKDGKVLFTKGYGSLSIEEDTPVNTETLFGIMSTTKAMTSAALGMLVDEGKVNWDDRVIQHLPEFQLYDPFVTREVRVRDLLTHNIGLGNTDFLWAYNAQADPSFILSQMRLAQPAYSFRGGYTYQNIMYLVAGILVEKLSGMTWERFMKERLYKPLGMNNTFPNLAYSMQYQNRSKAHQKTEEGIIIIPEMPADAIAPAGATWSTIDDMAKWVQFMLGDGKVGDLQILSAESKAEILKPQVIVPENLFYPTTQLTQPNWTTYGLGWFQQDYRGAFVAFHTGSLDGRTAIVGLLPEHDFGFYFFGNLDHAELRHALMLKSFDHFVFENNDRDWSTEIYNLYAGMNSAREKQVGEVVKMRVDNTKLSKGLDVYAGNYTHPFYGKVVVKKQDKNLEVMVGPNLKGSLSHWHYDTFQVTWDKSWWGTDFFQFNLSPVTAEITSLKFGGVDYQKE